MNESRYAARTGGKTVYVAVLSALALGGCATFSADGGFDSVKEVARARLGKETVWQRSEQDGATVHTEVEKLLSQPLSPDDAVRIALLNNRGLQATYAELGIAEADLVQAGRFPNPRFGYQRTAHGDERKIESSLTFNLFSLLTVPLATEIEARRFEQTKLDVAAQMLRVAGEARKAYFEAVAAQQSVKYMEDVKLAAEAAAELAARMNRAGNAGRLRQAREHLFYAETTAQLARVRLAAVSAREQLLRVLGLWGKQAELKLPDQLPTLPKQPDDLPGVEAQALRERLDLKAVRLRTEGLARSLGLTKATRFINVLEFGPARTTETPEPRKKGYELSFEIPLFDWGGARVAKAEALYMQAVHEAAEAAINARSEVRESYQAYRTAYDLAKHYADEIVPLRKRISEENLLRYNGMLIGVFELIADAREQVASVNASIDALRDYWVADADLRLAMTAGLGRPLGARLKTPAMPVIGGGEARH